jgi:branched-chain amino acid transport system substrate-binding protein
MKSARLAPLAACVVATLALAACGSDDNNSSTGSSGAAPSTAASTTEAAASASNGIEQSTIDFAAQYTGITPGKVDPALKPITIGHVNQEGGAPSFPENTKAADAVVKFINEKLGGVDGHAIKLERCVMQAEEDGQKCGAQLLQANVPIAEFSLAVIGNTAYYKTVNGKFPTLIGTTSAPADSVGKGAYSLGGGGAAVLAAMAEVAKTQFKSKFASVITVDNAGGKFSAEKIAIPYMDKIGLVHSKSVYYPSSATAPDILSALQAAQASKADTIILDPATPAECTAVYNGVKTLNLKAKVIGTPICNADAFVKSAGSAGPEDWVIVGFGVNPRVADDPQAKVFNNIMSTYGAAEAATQGFTPQVVRDFLSIAKFAKAIGPDKLTPAAFEEQIKAFKGPAFMIPGPLHCGQPSDPASSTLCGESAGISQFTGGKWSTLPDFTLPAS